MTDNFNELELAIFEWFKNTYANSQLAAQIESTRFLSREWTGVGFYVHFEISQEIEPIDLDDFAGHWPINGPNLASDDIEHGGGSMIWGVDGYIDCIEMYAHGDFFNETVNGFEVSL